MSYKLLYLGDFLEKSKELKNESVDLVVADPPFNLKKNYGKASDSLKREVYIEWVYKWLEECDRLLRPTGSIYVMNTQENSWIAQSFLESRGYLFRNTIAWKNSSMPVKNKFCIHYQPIIYFTKTNNYTFNYGVQEQESKAEMPYKRHLTKRKNSVKDYWDDIPFLSAGCMAKPESIMIPGTKKKIHPCQAPVALFERMILYSTNPGDVVLDPFGGLFSSGVAAIKNERSYRGFEINPEYFEIGEKRFRSDKDR